MAAAGVGQSEDENWGLTGDKLGMQPPAEPRTTAQKKSRATKMARENVFFSEVVSVFKNTQVAGTGFEQVQQTPGNSSACPQSGAKSGALLAENLPIDPQLQLLIDAWPTLSKAVQQHIMLLVG